MICIILLTFVKAMNGQESAKICSNPNLARNTVEQLWVAATRGQLLNSEGWETISRSVFVKPLEAQTGNEIFVVSNYWSVTREDMKDSAAEVTVDFHDAGRIDSELRYTHPRQTTAVKSGMLYRLVCGPSHYPRFKAENGKLIVDKVLTGPPAWQINSEPTKPFATVNTAIRYVLEKRNDTNNPKLRDNADHTLSQLLHVQ